MLLITGITGHTGRYFLQELINNKYVGPIRCVVRETSNTSFLDNSGLNIEKVVGDLNDPELINRVMDGVKVIVHIYNIHHSPTLVQAAVRNKVNRAILVHTTGIYSKFKYASEEYRVIEQKIEELRNALDCPTNITILRPSMIYGDLCDKNMSKFIKMVDKLRIMPVIEGGTSLIQPVNARDLGKTFYTILMSPDKTSNNDYDLSGDKPIKMIDVFRLISKELNKDTRYINIPMNMGVFIAKTLKVLTFGRLNFIEQVQRMGEDRSYSHENASSDFGYNPISFEEGIKKQVQEYIQKVEFKKYK